MFDVLKAHDGIKELIMACGDDPERDGLKDSPARFIDAMLEYTIGMRGPDPRWHLEKTFDVAYQELVMVRDITFTSLCEHHFAPFFGVAHVGYIPNKRVTGLSKIARMVEGYARRFQVQENLTSQIANAIQDALEPIGAMVVVDAKHMCMCGRGVNKEQSSTITSAVRGSFAVEPEARAEFLSLIRVGK